MVHATSYNLRFYPNVQQMRTLVETGATGEVLAVQGTYSQDWLFYATDYNWRLEPEVGGNSRAMADIGSHWCDMVEHVTGMKIAAVCAELATWHPVRKKPKKAIETYAGKLLKPEDYEDRPINTEDYGAILLRFEGRARGALTINQVAAGRKNRLLMEIYGTKCGLAWDGENPNELWIGRRDGNNEILIKDPSLLEEQARTLPIFPAATPKATATRSSSFSAASMRPFATARKRRSCRRLRPGCGSCGVVEAVLASSKQRAWVEIS